MNLHEYESVERKITHKWIGKPAFTFWFSRKDKIRTLKKTSAIKVAPDRTIDLLRFLVVSNTGELSLEKVMSQALSTFSLALFERQNSQLAHANCNHANDATLDYVP